MTERTPEENVRYLLKRIALEATRDGTIESLAARLGTHPNTIGAWMRKGYVPRLSAIKLEETFGPELAPADQLCFPTR